MLILVLIKYYYNMQYFILKIYILFLIILNIYKIYNYIVIFKNIDPPPLAS